MLLERDDLDLGTAVTALHRGVQDFLVEPVSEGELIARVAVAGRSKVLQEELLAQTRRLEARRSPSTVSIGTATWDGEPPEALLRRADDALYAAKAEARDRRPQRAC